MPEGTGNNFLEGGTAPPALCPALLLGRFQWQHGIPSLAGTERAGAGDPRGPLSLPAPRRAAPRVLWQGCFLRRRVKQRGLSHILTGDWALESDLDAVPGELQSLWEGDKGRSWL